MALRLANGTQHLPRLRDVGSRETGQASDGRIGPDKHQPPHNLGVVIDRSHMQRREAALVTSVRVRSSGEKRRNKTVVAERARQVQHRVPSWPLQVQPGLVSAVVEINQVEDLEQLGLEVLVGSRMVESGSATCLSTRWPGGPRRAAVVEDPSCQVA